jgi:hypothetical protein
LFGSRPSRGDVRLPRPPAVGPTAILLFCCACAGPGGSGTVPPAAPPECLLAAGGGVVTDSLVIGIPDSVEVARSVARSDGEALILRLLGRAGEIRPCPPAGEGSEPTTWRVAEARSGDLVLLPTAGGIPRLVVRVEPGADPRSLLDRGADLVVTRDARTIEYGADLDALESLPLPWDRIYVLAAPGGSDALAVAGDDADWTRAVRDESRRPGSAGWWEGGHCRGGESAATGLGLRYTARDATARDLADRIAALGARRGTTLAPGPIDPMSVGGGPTVLALPGVPPQSCAGVPRIPAAWQVIPLVETRARVIVRRGSAALVTDPDGGVRIATSRPGKATGQPRARESDR